MVLSRKITCLSGFSLARRWTKFNSVPTAHLEPAGDWVILFMIICTLYLLLSRTANILNFCWDFSLLEPLQKCLHCSQCYSVAQPFALIAAGQLTRWPGLVLGRLRKKPESEPAAPFGFQNFRSRLRSRLRPDRLRIFPERSRCYTKRAKTCSICYLR